MKGLVSLILSLCDVVEAEGQLLRLNAVRTTKKCALLVLGLSFGAAALAFLVAAAYSLLIIFLPPAAALAITGAICAAICLFFLWSSSLCVKPARTTKTVNRPKTKTP